MSTLATFRSHVFSIGTHLERCSSGHPRMHSGHRRGYDIAVAGWQPRGLARGAETQLRRWSYWRLGLKMFAMLTLKDVETQIGGCEDSDPVLAEIDQAM